MLASRILPPIIPRSPPPPQYPIATFVNIPRRYVKSNMGVGHDASDLKMEDARPVRELRKSSRVQELISSPVRRSSSFNGPTSAPISPPDTRKRAASFEDVAVGANSDDTESPLDPILPQSASSTGSGELSGHVCLCQPEPKIPRPRNAFILYRQHHQHAIVARNPGLANPEISKIIGEQWKAESEDCKKVWQDLAQEEKARHQEQYPDYRYQPRRFGKPGSLPSNPSVQHTTVDKYRCPRCGGRSIKTPTSPFSSTPALSPPEPSENSTPTTRYLPVMTSNLSLDSPAYRRRVPGPSGLSNIQVSSPAHDPPIHSPLTPESKRRRYNYSSSNNVRRSDTPYYTHHRRDSLPPVNHARPSPPNSASMLLPPRTPRDVRRGSVDLNVLVPNHHDQSRSVEAMVMSVPYHVKIKVLGRITPPLKDPGPTSPAVQIRGAIIAIEGDDLSAVKELTQWLKDFLSKAQDKEYKPRIAESPEGPQDSHEDVTFEDYLDLIKEWHAKSKEMIQYITTPVSSTPSSASASASASDTDADKEKDKHSDEKMSSPSSPGIARKPVVILPTYQLRASDLYTSRIPIQDAYSPTDHWQWMATLWRGTVGPDLTIYVNGDGKEGKLVELNEEVRCLTVKKEKGKNFEEAALRRVGFEVGEWIRGVEKST